MFDANARYLKKGAMFFANKGDDLLYCEMLDDERNNPRVKIITSHMNDKGYNGHIYQRDVRDWGFAVLAGYVNDGKLQSFINNQDIVKAKEILNRVEDK